MEQAIYNLFQTQEQDYPSLLPLEAKIFESAAFPNLLQGIVYVVPLLFNGNLFVRYLCTGAYQSAIDPILDILQTKTNIHKSRIYPWKINTLKDLQLQRKTFSTSTNLETTYSRKVGSQDSSKTNKTGVLPLLNDLKPQLDGIYSILFIHKAKVNTAKPTHR